MNALKTLFLAWQDPNSRFWFPIGRLTFDGVTYVFVYIQGVKEAQQKCGFEALTSFPRLNEVYTSIYLFPVFANRLMPRSRPDYSTFIQWLNISQDQDDPIAILSRSGGQRQTDTLSVFPCPEPDEDGRYHLHFLAHELQYLPRCAIERINRCEVGEKLWLAHEFQNPYDAQALTLTTEDHHIIGYCPRYLLNEVFKLLESRSLLEMRVERVNPPHSPLQFRLLCHMTAQGDKRPFSSPEYQPLSNEVAIFSR